MEEDPAVLSPFLARLATLALMASNLDVAVSTGERGQLVLVFLYAICSSRREAIVELSVVLLNPNRVQVRRRDLPNCPPDISPA